MACMFHTTQYSRLLNHAVHLIRQSEPYQAHQMNKVQAKTIGHFIHKWWDMISVEEYNIRGVSSSHRAHLRCVWRWRVASDGYTVHKPQISTNMEDSTSLNNYTVSGTTKFT
jgi:hypothetical protein